MTQYDGLEAPQSRTIRIQPDTPTRLGDRPDTHQLEGTHFDVDLSQALGFESYPVGGNVGYVSRAVAEAWGKPWVNGGWVEIEFRRPLYGDTDVHLDFAPVHEVDGSLVTKYTFTYDGIVCWRGRAGLPLEPVEPTDLSDFPVTPGTMPSFRDAPQLVGTSLATRDLKFESSIFAAAAKGGIEAIQAPPTWYGNCYKRIAYDISVLAESQPWLLEESALTPWQVFPGLMDTTGAHFTMQVSSFFQFFGKVSMDQPMQFRTRLVEAYENKGSQYASHDHVLVAGNEVLMFNRWTVLYDYAKAKASGGAARA
jgi:hypothetical protein